MGDKGIQLRYLSTYACRLSNLRMWTAMYTHTHTNQSGHTCKISSGHMGRGLSRNGGIVINEWMYVAYKVPWDILFRRISNSSKLLRVTFWWNNSCLALCPISVRDRQFLTFNIMTNNHSVLPCLVHSIFPDKTSLLINRLGTCFL